MLLDGVAHEDIVTRERNAHPIGILLPQPGTPLDVGEENRNGAGCPMKRIVPVYVHCVCLAIATAMTTLIIGVHAVDLKTLGAAEIVIGVASAVASLSVNAANRCASPASGAEARACAADREGPEALRRFINRTRVIYQFYYWDFRSPEPAATVAQNAGRSVVQAQDSANGTAR